MSHTGKWWHILLILLVDEIPASMDFHQAWYQVSRLIDVVDAG
ncbi:hypothetical protein APS_2655 [Acetobacter pasteurianus subsp. pasteurianus LMG 1262 = NBRC 106471]|nr:hypothetical protein APS_2655 [Acetobacter pasteurianus subsp. pasteurianus LMG 1262 = NBRC 106471]